MAVEINANLSLSENLDADFNGGLLMNANLGDAIHVTTDDYNDLNNKPQINSVELSGNKSLTDLGVLDTTLTVSGKAADAKVVGDALATKAEIDGYYDEMAVGSAEQLISTVLSEDTEPYTYRTTGGSADVGSRVNLKQITGGTVAMNQLYNPSNISTITSNGITFTKNDDGTISASGTAMANVTLQLVGALPVVANHKMLIKGCPAGGSSATYAISTSGYSDYGNGIVVNNNASDTRYIWILIVSGTSIETPLTFRPQVFDLTQMFGSTIADYIYTLEQSTAGAGVAWFRKLFPEDYYPYNAGELVSVQTSGRETVGFNQWDEEWVNGFFNDSGAFVSRSDIVGAKNAIPVLPDTEYYFNANVTGMFVTFWSDKVTTDSPDVSKLISRYQIPSTKKFTTPSGCKYIFFNMPAAYGTTYNHDICINLSHSGYRNGEYEPYEKHTYPLSPVTLRGIPTLSDGEMVYDGDSYTPDGTVTRRYGVVDLGTLNWSYSDTRVAFNDAVPNMKAGSMLLRCVKYQFGVVVSYASQVGSQDDKAMYTQKGNAQLFIKDSSYTDAATFKTAMSGVYLVYELATPTTETADPYHEIQIVDDFGTERFLDAPIPVGTVSEYQANLRDKLQHLPDLASSNGTYAIQQTGKQMTLLPLTTPTELPTAPTTDGAYVLKVTVSNGTAVYTWEAQT